MWGSFRGTVWPFVSVQIVTYNRSAFLIQAWPARGGSNEQRNAMNNIHPRRTSEAKPRALLYVGGTPLFRKPFCRTGAATDCHAGLPRAIGGDV